MPIQRKAEPPRARAILTSSLAKRAHHAKHVGALRGKVQVFGPVPVFSLGFEAPNRPHPLRSVLLVGWNYLLTGGETPGLAHLHSRRGKLSFAGITQGPAAEHLIHAATLADDSLKPVKRSYEARILEIPSLRIHALWLYARDGHSRFVELGRGTPDTHKLATLREIEKRIATALRLFRSRKTPSSRRKPRWKSR
jgi:hypothetical protein